MRVVCAYVPNAEASTRTNTNTAGWLAPCTTGWPKEALQHPHLGRRRDYNIAPDDRDVHDPVAWAGQVLVSDKERAALQRLFDIGLTDAFRLFEQADKSFSWWDYRQLGFRLNKGLRIDHILLSPALAGRCKACVIDRVPRKWEQPSDHAPVVATID